MDELEWLKEHSPSTRPSRDTARRHRTQLRAAIAAEGADGHRPRRPRRERRSRHRVLVTTALVIALCAAGAGVVAVTSSGGDEGSTVGAPAASNAPTTAPAVAPQQTCADAPPRELAIPAGFGTGIAAPSGKQQATSWTSDQATIEQRWPADTDKVPGSTGTAPGDSFTAVSDPSATVDAKGVAHQTIVFRFGGQPAGCDSLQVTVSGKTIDVVESITNGLLRAPFHSNEPLVTTTGTAASAPPVVACEGVTNADSTALAVPALAVPAVASVGGPVQAGAFSRPADALAEFLTGQPTLAQHGYQEQRLDDSSVVYVKAVRSNVVTTVRVTPMNAGWTVTDWEASGC